MRFLILKNIIFTSFLLLSSPASSAVLTENQYRSYVDRVADTMIKVWKNDIKPGIDDIPEFTGKAQDLELRWAPACRIIPYYDPYTSIPSVVIDRREMMAIMPFIQQAVLFHILGMDEVPTAKEIDNYVTDEIQPLIRQRIEECATSQAPKPIAPSEIFKRNYFAKKARFDGNYEKVLGKALALHKAGILADQIAAFPAFMAIIHEAGHHILHRGGHEDAILQELEADQVVIEVFQKNNAPLTLGLPFFQMFVAEDDKNKLRCRISRLAKADTQIAKAMSQFSPFYTKRLELMRTYYQTKFEKFC